MDQKYDKVKYASLLQLHGSVLSISTRMHFKHSSLMAAMVAKCLPLFSCGLYVEIPLGGAFCLSLSLFFAPFPAVTLHNIMFGIGLKSIWWKMEK